MNLIPHDAARRLALTVAAAVSLAAPTAASAQAEGSIHGLWRNPKNSVHVEIRPCSAGACGYVRWASAKAQADARKGGTENLIGMQLLRNFSQDKNGSWRGKVFVPDLNATFSGSAQLVDGKTLKAKGCLIGNIGCKAQLWTRIDTISD